MNEYRHKQTEKHNNNQDKNLAEGCGPHMKSLNAAAIILLIGKATGFMQMQLWWSRCISCVCVAALVWVHPQAPSSAEYDSVTKQTLQTVVLGSGQLDRC